MPKIDQNFSKDKIRKIFKDKRNSLSQEQNLFLSRAISKNFIKFFEKNIKNPQKKIISLYIAINNEASSSLIAKFFENKKISFCYPKITEKNYELEFILAQQNQHFEANKIFKKISEPQFGKIVTPDILIVPLLAFDNSLNRLGMGKGFYDRTIFALKNTKPNLVTIGLAFDFQCFDHLLPIDNNDQKLDFIITEKRTIFASQHALSDSTIY